MPTESRSTESVPTESRSTESVPSESVPSDNWPTAHVSAEHMPGKRTYAERISGRRSQRDVSARRPHAPFTPPDLFLDDVDLDALHAEADADYATGFERSLGRDEGTPSLPVILVSAACGMGGGVLGLYFSYALFDWPVVWVAATTTLTLLFCLGLSGALMSAATGSRAAPANILFSCGLIVAAALFLGLCLTIGALAATLLWSL